MTRILILCTGNSARSQMAAAFLQSYDPELEVFSAGTRPAGEVHPCAVRVMDEIGMDISSAYPKSVEQYLDEPFDFVVTVCGGAEESCPVFRGQVKRRLHIGFDDPAAFQGEAEEVFDEFRRVRDQISIRFRDFYLVHVRAATPRLRPAGYGDLDAVSRLFPVQPQFPEGYAIVQAYGELAGAAGIEVIGEDGLLRALSVAPQHRRSGIGTMLVQDRVAGAARLGLRAVYAVTAEAAEFFETIGFWTIEPDEAPEAIRAACPAGSTLLCLTLR